QTIFHPFAQASKYAHGEVLRLKTECTQFESGAYKHAPHLLASGLADSKTGACALFALNRGAEEMTLEAELRGLGVKTIRDATELRHKDLKAVNSKQNPDAVAPRRNESAALRADTLRATLGPHSWNVIALA